MAAAAVVGEPAAVAAAGAQVAAAAETQVKMGLEQSAADSESWECMHKPRAPNFPRRLIRSNDVQMLETPLPSIVLVALQRNYCHYHPSVSLSKLAS